MQKLDFISKLTNIASKLKTYEINEIVNKSYLNHSFDFTVLSELLFESKSNYDILNADKNYNKLLSNLDIATFYLPSSLTRTVKIFNSNSSPQVLSDPQLRLFFSIHKSIEQLLKITKLELINDIFLQNYDTQLDLGILVFQITIEGEGLDAGIYSEIFSTLKELVIIINKINGNDNEKTEIILLDSGSDTNTAIKTTAETAKSLFLIFKEMWDFFINRKYYQNKQHNQALVESLSIMQEVKNNITNGILTEEQGKEYIHLVKSRTDKLIGLKTMPKTLMLENNNIDNIKLLNEMKETKLLN